MMSGLQVTSTAMQLLPLVCVSLLTWSGTTFGDGNGPAVINMVVYEDSDVVLPCSLNTTNITLELFDWKKDGPKEVFMYDKGKHYNNGRAGQDEQFKGRVSHFPEQLEFGNASITIRNTKVTDSGRYTCDFPHRHQPKRRANIELVVGAAPEPSVTSLQQTNNWALLQCKAHGAPKPELHWQDSAGNILPAETPQVTERGGRFYVTLQITVNKTDLFRCVATQEEIHHQTYAETHEYINGAASKPVIMRLDETKDWALLRCEVQGASPEPEVEWQDRAGNVLPAEKTQFSDQEGRFDITLQTTVTKTGHYRCVATQKKINHQIYTETLVYLDGVASKPNIVTLDETKDWALLRCEVRGHSPEPEVEWQDSDGNVLPGKKTQVSDQEGRSYITLQTTVTKTDHYRCVATQKKINHQIYTETLVHLDGFPVGWVVAAVLAVLLVGVGVVLGVKRYKSQERKKDRSVL